MSQRTRAHTTGAAPRPNKVMARDETGAPEAPGKRYRRKSPAEPITPADAEKARGGIPSEPAELEMAEVSPGALARMLRAVATELERDPVLARRVASAMSGISNGGREPRLTTPEAAAGVAGKSAADEAPAATVGRTFHPTIVTGVTPDLGSGVPDPFALRERLGGDGLREVLATLRLGSLRAIVREHKLDPSGRLSKLNDAEKLRERIVQATMARK